MVYKEKQVEVTENISDVRCKQNSAKLIGRKTCKNNCGYYDNVNRKCKLGYRHEKKPRKLLLSRKEDD